MIKPGVKYSEIRPKLKSFDLLLFKGTDLVSSALSRLQCKIDGADWTEGFSHAGLCIRSEDLLPTCTPAELSWLFPDMVYVFESTMSGDLADGVKDVWGESKLGVQIRDLDRVMIAYDANPNARLAWCPIKEELRQFIPAGSIRKEYEKYRGYSYDASAVDLAAAAFPSMRPLRDNCCFQSIRDALCCCCCGGGEGKKPSQWQFCSEMVANVYKDVSLFGDRVNAADVMPMDFVPDKTKPCGTLDADGVVPNIFSNLVRYHHDFDIHVGESPASH